MTNLHWRASDKRIKPLIKYLVDITKEDGSVIETFVMEFSSMRKLNAELRSGKYWDRDKYLINAVML